MKMKKPEIIKKNSNEHFKESGCCFRSCGETPVIQQNEPKKNLKGSRIGQALKRIK